MTKVKNIHFVGIKGVGMTPLAIIAKEAGIKVTGSDVDKKFITDEALSKAGIVAGSFEDKLPHVDLVITTGAHGGLDNSQVVEAKDRNIPVMSQGEALGEFMKGEILGAKFDGISIAGCHGKTTTTAMIATLMSHNKLDPSYLIGTSGIKSLGNPGHFGRGNYLIAEADEYATDPKYDKTPKFMWQSPLIQVITNIEFDHPDLYSSLDELRDAYVRFTKKQSPNGVLITLQDDDEVRKLLKQYTGRAITFGFSPIADYSITRINMSEEKMFFWVESHGTSLGEFSLNVLGEHNALNALASIVVGLEVGLSIEQIKDGISAYKGSKRRMEYLGQTNEGALIFDDYAHHPTEIKETLSAFKKSYPKRDIICIFQPHTYSRTKSLFEEFSRAFTDANRVILTDIYSSQREEVDTSVSSSLLSEEISKYHKSVLYLPKFDDVIEYLVDKNPGQNSLVLTMGAGDIYEVTEGIKINR